MVATCMGLAVVIEPDQVQEAVKQMVVKEKWYSDWGLWKEQHRVLYRKKDIEALWCTVCICNKPKRKNEIIRVCVLITKWGLKALCHRAPLACQPLSAVSPQEQTRYSLMFAWSTNWETTSRVLSCCTPQGHDQPVGRFFQFCSNFRLSAPASWRTWTPTCDRTTLPSHVATLRTLRRPHVEKKPKFDGKRENNRQGGDWWSWSMGFKAEGTPRVYHCEWKKTPASLGYPLSVFNKNSTPKYKTKEKRDNKMKDVDLRPGQPQVNRN